MNVDNINQVGFIGSKNPKNMKEVAVKSTTKTSDTDACLCQCSYNLGLLNIKKSKDDMINEAEAFAKQFINEGENIGRTNIKLSEKETIVRTRIGTPIEGFPDLYNYDTYLSFYFDENKKIDKAFKYNSKTNEIDVYSKDGELIHHYTKEDREALYYYKYHPDAIHRKLREDRNIYSGSFLSEMLEMLDKLERLFEDESKVFRTNEDRILYRALQNNLSEHEVVELSTIGGVYTDKSFCSTTEDLDVAKRFWGGNPILKINVPKGTKYMDVERLFNVDREHWKEKELLLDKNSKFLVTGFDEKNNIIEVDYIG
ncbi:hypothetical protein IJD44_05765 [bacterium]|nr:hypothetical protein [bacterium]